MKKSDLRKIIREEILKEGNELQLVGKNSVIRAYFNDHLNNGGVRFHDPKTNDSITLDSQQLKQLQAKI